MDTKSIVEKAQARKGEWPVLAREAGVSYSWLVKFMGGEIPNPGVRTLTKLAAALSSSPSPASARSPTESAGDITPA